MFVDRHGRGFQDGSRVHNMKGYGPVGEVLDQMHFDPGLLRPYFDKKGRPVVSVLTGHMTKNSAGEEVPEQKVVPVAEMMRRGVWHPVFNSTTMRLRDWVQWDRRVIMATRQRLRAWADLAAANPVSGFNGMAKMTYEYEAMTDPGEAMKDMDVLSDGRTDSPLYKLRSIPLPVTHSDFWFSQRRLLVSNNSTPISSTMAEAAGRRVAEMIERTTIGLETGITYGTETTGYGTHDGTSTEYGYTNFPYRMTKTDLNAPTGSNPEAVKQDVIEMREQMYAAGFYGPFMLYHSTGYDAYLDDDYFRSGGTSAVTTTRARILEIDNIQGIRRLDYLTSGYQLILVQMTPDVAEAIIGMDVTTMQWESQGGMRKNFKVMAINVPLLKAPYNGVAGIVHGTTS